MWNVSKLASASKHKDKIEKVMSEYKSGTLHSGSKSGPVVQSKDQAVAIALSEARKEGDNKDGQSQG